MFSEVMHHSVLCFNDSARGGSCFYHLPSDRAAKTLRRLHQNWTASLSGAASEGNRIWGKKQGSGGMLQYLRGPHYISYYTTGSMALLRGTGKHCHFQAEPEVI